MATKSEIERLSVVETKVDAIAEDVKSINNKLDGLDGKYAAKWVQTAVAFVVGLIVAAVIAALMLLVLPDKTAPIIAPTNSQTTTTTTPTGSTSKTNTSSSPDTASTPTSDTPSQTPPPAEQSPQPTEKNCKVNLLGVCI